MEPLGEVKRLLILRLASWSIMMFSTGLITGWWLHERLPMPSQEEDSTVLIQEWSPLPEFLPTPHTAEEPPEFGDFEQALDEQRYDDALVIYQRQEIQSPQLFEALRQRFLRKIDQWLADNQPSQVITVLERFTQHYYQDQSLLARLSQTLIDQKELAKAIEVQLSARSYEVTPSELEKLTNNIHKLSQSLFEQQSKRQRLDEILELLQRLAMLEPEYAFYRYALAETYLSMDDVDSAIRELEILQVDAEFGRKASDMLTKLLPPPPEEPEEDLPVNTIPLSTVGNHYIVSVNTGGEFNARLLIDTGASLTTLPTETLLELKRKKLAHRVGHTELKTANGFRFSPIYRLKEFQIGGYSLKNLEVAGLDMGSMESDGLLGMNVLGQFHFQINQDQNTLLLQPR